MVSTESKNEVDINFNPKDAIDAGEEVVTWSHLHYMLPSDEAYRYLGEVKVDMKDEKAINATLDNATKAGFWFFLTKKPNATKNYSVHIYGTREHTAESAQKFIDFFNELEGKKEL